MTLGHPTNHTTLTDMTGSEIQEKMAEKWPIEPNGVIQMPEIAFLGDSTTEGTIEGPGRIGAFTTYLDFGPGFTINNFGYSGSGVADFGEVQLQTTGTYSAYLATAPDLVWIMIGINDINAMFSPDGPLRFTEDSPTSVIDAALARYFAGLKQLVDDAKALTSNPQIVLSTQQPWFEPGDWLGSVLYETRVIPGIMSLAAAENVLFANPYPTIPWNRDLFPDRTHFSAEGAQLMAQSLSEIIPETVPSLFSPIEPLPGTTVTGSLETGTVTFGQEGPDDWKVVTFSSTITNARVVVSPPTATGEDMGVIRVRNVTDTGFEFQLDEWDYLDGFHGAETISWMAMTAGTHALATGQIITAGRAATQNSDPATVSLTGHSEALGVFAQVTSANGSEAVTDQVSAVTSSGFSVRLVEEEAGDQIHASETIDYIVIDAQTNTDTFVFNMTGVGRSPTQVSHSQGPAAALFAEIQTSRNTDTAALRLGLSTDGTDFLFIEEEESRDFEFSQPVEDVSVLVAELGVTPLYEFLG
ncbi:MAG: SGNH/GDSL hydrolase family protein [Pseudomonadota bacterium]